jgi:hypothetical protein
MRVLDLNDARKAKRVAQARRLEREAPVAYRLAMLLATVTGRGDAGTWAQDAVKFLHELELDGFVVVRREGGG